MSTTDDVLGAARDLVQSCTSARPDVQDLGDAADFSHDVTTVIRPRAGEQAVSERA